MSTPTVCQTKNLVPSKHAMPPSEAQVDIMVNSIKAYGIIEPIVVRSIGSRFEITPGGGQVRWVAAKRLGLDIVPIRVAQFDNGTMAAMALIGSTQREFIEPAERLGSLERMVDEFGVDAADTVLEQLQELEESISDDIALQARLKALLNRCGISGDEI